MKDIAKKIFGYIPGTGYSLGLINFIFQRIFRLDSEASFIKHYTSRVLHPKHIHIENDCPVVMRSFQVSGGCYFNGADGIEIGQGTIWAPNISVVSQIHDFYDFDLAPKTKGIRIGRQCWLGAGSVILQDVELGDRTIVGANAVVTKSYPEGNVILAGAPARPIRQLPPAPGNN